MHEKLLLRAWGKIWSSVMKWNVRMTRKLTEMNFSTHIRRPLCTFYHVMFWCCWMAHFVDWKIQHEHNNWDFYENFFKMYQHLVNHPPSTSFNLAQAKEFAAKTWTDIYNAQTMFSLSQRERRRAQKMKWESFFFFNAVVTLSLSLKLKRFFTDMWERAHNLLM